MNWPSDSKVLALCGGVGGAKLALGLTHVLSPDQLTIVVNTGDDFEHFGLTVCPDLDTVTYTLSGLSNPDLGWGRQDESWNCLEALGQLGAETWFRLGDRDFATCQHRTLRLADGAGLAEITDEIRRALGVETRILPMSEDACPTFVELGGGRRPHFEEYLVRDGAPNDVEGVDLTAARNAKPGPGVLEALRNARTIVFCPSNPVVSIGPILALPGVPEALAESGTPVVAISPIVGGAPLKGPADALLRGIGAEVSARGVARLYRELVGGFVLDERDRRELADIEALGLRARAVDTIMRDTRTTMRLAEAVLELAAELR